MKEKTMRLGSKKLALKLNAMYDCSMRTLDEASIDEDFNSGPSQDRSTDDGKVASDVRSSNTNCPAPTKRENSCSTKNAAADDNELRVANKTSSGPSRLKKYNIFGKTKFFSKNGNRAALARGDEDVPMEPIRAHAIIFTIEENSADTQVFL